MSDSKISEQQVIAYLQDHLDFFEHNEELLAELKLPHKSGNAVSLVERQMTTMRSQLANCKTELHRLIELARDNDSLNTRLHRMTVELFDSTSLDDVIDSLQNHLRDQFKADAVEVKLFSSNDMKKAAESGSAGPALFLDLMQNGKPTCGKIHKDQMHYLFGDLESDAGSVALVPLQGLSISGILAIGNSNPDHFHCGQGTDFLRRLGDIVVKAFEAVELA